uniref:Calmodulin n=1 Tax=Leptocylindrus danicus TaxID=163516 RepID=A0A7S2NUG7_9STRA|mmetsp:Transcript_12567/g.18882  ORF Transcript_12567/g.18882 Transcript_12567/m.18882 type:complete len:110 (+) Transcript_12567:1-330(+)
MKSMGRLFTRKEVEEMIADVDVDENGSIEFDEFLLMMCRDEDSEFELLEAFKKFDKDGDGEVTANEVRDVLAKFGQKLSDAELEAMMAEVDENGDGVISFAEFKQLMGN